MQRLRFATALYAADGSFLAGQQVMIYLSLKDDNLARLKKDGLVQRVSMQIPSGNYSLRYVVQEALEGKLGAATRKVEIQ